MKKLFTILAFTAFLATGSMAAYANDNTTGESPAAPQDAHHHWSAFDGLPPQDAQLIHDTMKKAHPDIKPLIAQAKKIYQDLQTILTTEPFDEKAFVSAHAKLQAIQDKIKAKTTAAFASALAQLSPEDRKIIADAMAKRHKGAHGKGEWHKDTQSSQPKSAATPE